MRTKSFIILTLAQSLLLGEPLLAGTISYGLARFGSSYTAALFANDPLVGLEVTRAEILLSVESYEGSDAASFVTDIALPIDTGLGSRAFTFRGSDHGWSGSGRFEYSETTDRFNGRLIAARYGSETFGDAFDGQLLLGRIDLEVPGYTRGDFDFNGRIDNEDIDYLTDNRLQGQFGWFFDLSGDGRLNEEDHRLWVTEIAGTFYGDANLDGQFDSRDLVSVFDTGHYEDGIKQNSGWAAGDWNGDADFDSRDFVVALAQGGYNQGPRTLAVPEPCGGWAYVMGAVLFATKRRHHSWLCLT